MTAQVCAVAQDGRRTFFSGEALFFGIIWHRLHFDALFSIGVIAIIIFANVLFAILFVGPVRFYRLATRCCRLAAYRCLSATCCCRLVAMAYHRVVFCLRYVVVGRFGFLIGWRRVIVGW